MCVCVSLPLRLCVTCACVYLCLCGCGRFSCFSYCKLLMKALPLLFLLLSALLFVASFAIVDNDDET